MASKVDLGSLIDSVKAGMGFGGAKPAPRGAPQGPASLIPNGTANSAPVANWQQAGFQPPTSRPAGAVDTIPVRGPNLQAPGAQLGLQGSPGMNPSPAGTRSPMQPGLKLGPVQYHPAVGLHLKVLQ
jgi:hypothetical protein